LVCGAVSLCLAHRLSPGVTFLLRIKPHLLPPPPPLLSIPSSDWPEPGEGSENDLAAYWQEDWDNGSSRSERALLSNVDCFFAMPSQTNNYVAEDVDADFAQQLRVELQKSEASKH
jgi:hypothetical protein